MHRLLPLGLALAFLGPWLGFVPMSVDDSKCGSLYQPKALSTDFGADFPAELLGPAGDAFGSVNQACEDQRRMLAYPMVSVVFAGIGIAVLGGVAWRRKAVAARAA